MFILVFAVPALLVVLLGYAVGYGLWTWIGGLAESTEETSTVAGAEPAGWITGALLLLGVLSVVLLRRRRARRARGRSG